ncbi:MAG: MATE family efflux transporter [Lachnospiraceae bacterium]|nr:MATE family efflux transporter [Lachnospiraceae bacterium]
MAQTEQGRLTEGPILKVLTKLALPIMASSFLSTAYSITDMAWIGTLGAKAVAGVGVGGMYVWLSQGLASLARMGGQVHVAQELGRGDRERAKKYSAAAIQLVIFFGVLFGAVCLLFPDQLIAFFGMKDTETLIHAKSYLMITCGMIVFSYVNFTLTGLFTAQGDATTPFQANFVGLIVNMILDPVLILGIGIVPRMEAAGAAIATVTAQIVVTAVFLICLACRGKKKKYKDADKVRATVKDDNIIREIRLTHLQERSYYADVVRIGGPTALQGSVYCMISMVLTRMVAAFGAGAVATQRVGGQIESVSWNTADGFAAALNAFIGQNFGGGRMERVRKGYRAAFSTILVWGVGMTLIFVLFPMQISGLFFHEAEVLPVASRYMVIVGFSEAFMCVELTAVGAISGLGKTKICSIISVCLTALRIPLALLLSRTGLGLEGIWWALTITSMLKGIVLHLTFLRLSGSRKMTVK